MGARSGFQSTPVIANGRILRWDISRATFYSFNPRPLLLTGESIITRLEDIKDYVSIHARYC